MLVQVQVPWTDRKAAAAPVVSRQPWGDCGCASTKQRSEINYLSGTLGKYGFLSVW
jgi:hypothetical protein